MHIFRHTHAHTFTRTHACIQTSQTHITHTSHTHVQNTSILFMFCFAGFAAELDLDLGSLPAFSHSPSALGLHQTKGLGPDNLGKRAG